MELPRLEPLYQKYRDQGFSVVAIDGMADTDRARKFIDDHGLSYPMLENGEGDADIVRNVFGVRTFPTSYLVDADDRVLFVHVGFEEGDEQKIEQEIRKVLGL